MLAGLRLLLGALLVVPAAALVEAQGTLSLREVGASILKGAKGVDSLRGKTVAGFSAGECTVDLGGLVASLECSNGRTLEEADAKPVLDALLSAARAELKAPAWKEAKWIGAKAGASFKHASGAEIDIGIPEDLLAGLPNSYGPVMLIALAADQ